MFMVLLDSPGGNFGIKTVGYTRMTLRRNVQATERNRFSMHKWNWNLGVVEIAWGQFIEPRGERSMDSTLEQNK